MGKLQTLIGATVGTLDKVRSHGKCCHSRVQDLASTYGLRPRPRTGCPDFGIGGKGLEECGVRSRV